VAKDRVRQSTIFAVLVSPMQYFRKIVLKIEVKTLLIFLQLHCRKTFIEIYRFIVHNFSKKNDKISFYRFIENFRKKYCLASPKTGRPHALWHD
jgi:hypothetical protein